MDKLKMRIDKQVIASVITLMMAGGLISVATTSRADDAQMMERCYGVVKAGKSDCDTNLPSCPDQPIIDADPNYWIYLPKGVCDKIVGGVTKPDVSTTTTTNSSTSTSMGSGNSPTPSTNSTTTTTTTKTVPAPSTGTSTNDLTPNNAVQY